MIRCLLIISLLALNANAQEAVDEQALAKNNVWHAAKLRGVSFRAIGQEPAWLLEISEGKEIIIKANYGQDVTRFDYVEPKVDQDKRQTLFRLNKSHSILIEGISCTDSMSGENFQSKVTITMESTVYRGCGRALY